MKVMLYQHGGSYNHGCEALATTISQSIKSVLPDAQVVLCSHHKAQDVQYAISSLDDIIESRRWLRRGTLGWFVYQIEKRCGENKKIQELFEIERTCLKTAETADLCIAIGGDNYCYNKGKIYWPLERVLKKKGKTMMLWGCSVEPDELPGELADHLQVFDLITARDSITYQALCDNGLQDKTVFVSDPAFLLEPEEAPLPSGWKDGNMVGLNFSPMLLDNAQNKDKVTESVYALIDDIFENTDMNIALIPHVRLPYTDDMDVLRPIFEKYKATGRMVLIDDMALGCKQLKYYISKCRFFFGARTHSIIAAYSTGVPALALGYSVKAKGIATDLFGTDDNYVVSARTLDDPTATVRAFRYVMDNELPIRDTLNRIMPEYKERARLSATAMMTMLAGRDV